MNVNGQWLKVGFEHGDNVVFGAVAREGDDLSIVDEFNGWESVDVVFFHFGGGIARVFGAVIFNELDAVSVDHFSVHFEFCGIPFRFELLAGTTPSGIEEKNLCCFVCVLVVVFVFTIGCVLRFGRSMIGLVDPVSCVGKQSGDKEPEEEG